MLRQVMLFEKQKSSKNITVEHLLSTIFTLSTFRRVFISKVSEKTKSYYESAENEWIKHLDKNEKYMNPYSKDIMQLFFDHSSK